MQSQTGLNKTEMNRKTEEINNIIQERVLNLSKDKQAWEQIRQGDKQNQIRETANEIQQQLVNTIGVKVGAETIAEILKIAMPNKPTSIKGFGR